MKKIILRKSSEIESISKRKFIGYRIKYQDELNPAQYEAVMHNDGAALVIAGAGTGKTRTLIYRVARLVEDGNIPESILLLTFTRKSSSEMLRRAANMLDGRCEKVSGGTFHSFSLLILRKFAKLIGYEENFGIVDSSDSEDIINLIRSRLKFDKSKRRFPRKDTLGDIFNLSINRRKTIEDIVLHDYPQFSEEVDSINIIFNEFREYKKKYNLMDYDDLLSNLLLLLKSNPETRSKLNNQYKYILVDEYQDTNKLQNDIIIELSRGSENIMAVGDDAQSIYSFRGAEFQNIMSFPDNFNSCKVYRIEENYRSNMPILDLTNRIIQSAAFKYDKELYSHKPSDFLPAIVSASNDRQQSEFVVQQILELREEGYKLEEIAVLFRSGFLSFDLEVELNKSNIAFRKYGGLKFIETAHVKDLLAFFKVVANERDAVSWNRLLLLLEGVGPRTAEKITEQIITGSIDIDNNFQPVIHTRGTAAINDLFNLIKELKYSKKKVGSNANQISEFYKPILKRKYDDWNKRTKDIEMFINISEKYKNINDFLSDISLDPPVESVVDIEAESLENEYLTLSTIHSAKGLEWRVVFLIWALDGRFPSSKSFENLNSLEEERRLFYVACTRAKDRLFISYPINIYDRIDGTVLSKPSRFLDGIGEDLADRFVITEFESSEN